MEGDERLDSSCLRHCAGHLETSRTGLRIRAKRAPMAPASRRICIDPGRAETARFRIAGVAMGRAMRDTVRHTIP
ncbi:hypothetical protein WS88_25005 [Burkholderia cepacia]|uniref:Uncharacterized protein n=1 Tax=Burkholderia cepacia TaxID=292 RepID=A0A118IS05_BURCE|nr:hypothetical protein WS88_25005 [Burkholderia cepacia]KVK86035.1 hypothetical protein WS90_06995 [Burkholderia cepacia]